MSNRSKTFHSRLGAASVATHADGAVAIQISQPIGQLLRHRGIETFEGTSLSLVKGFVTLSAIGPSITAGMPAREIKVSGGNKTHGAGVAPIEHHGSIPGSTESPLGNRDFVAMGGEFDKICTLKCACGHARNAQPRTLAALAGWDARLDVVVKRMRCSRCGERRCSATVRPQTKRDG